jgi:hypothetical protein
VTYRLSENLREHQQEERADKVDSSDGNVETVRLLVHPRAQYADTNEKGKLDQDEGNCLCLSTLLSKANEHGLDEQVSEPWDDEPVSRGLELYVQETPLVESNWVRVKNVGRVLVHGNGALCDADHLGRSPTKNTNHGNHGQDGEDNDTSGVALGQLPETEHHHLGEANEDNTEEDALQDSLPAVAEIEELVALQLAGLGKSFADELEGDDANDGEDDEDHEKGIAGEEDVGRLDVGLESHTLDAV